MPPGEYPPPRESIFLAHFTPNILARMLQSTLHVQTFKCYYHHRSALLTAPVHSGPASRRSSLPQNPTDNSTAQGKNLVSAH